MLCIPIAKITFFAVLFCSFFGQYPLQMSEIGPGIALCLKVHYVDLHLLHTTKLVCRKPVDISVS